MSTVPILAVECDRCGEVVQFEPDHSYKDPPQPLAKFIDQLPRGWGRCALERERDDGRIDFARPDLCPECFEHISKDARRTT
jgi:hypothetical protein